MSDDLVKVNDDDLVKVTVSEGKYTFVQRKGGSCYALRHGEPWREDIYDGMTLAMAYRIEELEAELHTMKTAGVIEVAIRNPNVSEYITHWERRAEGAETKLAKIESLMVHLVKFAEQSKAAANSGNSKRREHYRMHTLSEALGQIRKIIKGEK